MALDPKKLDRLNGVLVRFLDPNEGSAIAALDGFRSMCASQHIDLRDYEIKPQKPGTDPATELRNLYKMMNEEDAKRKQLVKELAEAKRQHAADNRNHSAEVRKLETELRLANDVIKLLQKTARRTDNSATEKITALETESAAAKTTIAQLKSSNTDSGAIAHRIADLEAELNMYRDPWHQDVRAWLEARPNEHRHHTRTILTGALPWMQPEWVDKERERRLGEIMRRIGGWRPSEPVGGRLNRGRGYVRDPP